MTTGESIFAPHAETNYYYYPETELAIFTLLDEEATDIEKVCAALEKIGKFGFGKDASTGCGRFRLGEDDEGAVFVTKKPEVFKSPYIGKAVFNTSKIKKHTVVHQGYAIYLPFRMEMINERTN